MTVVGVWGTGMSSACRAMCVFPLLGRGTRLSVISSASVDCVGKAPPITTTPSATCLWVDSSANALLYPRAPFFCSAAAAAPPVVLDLLGMDPSPSDGAAAGDGGGAAEAVANGKEGTAAAGAMLTSMALAPSMMGPVGAARGAASEMAALCGEVGIFSSWFFTGGLGQG